MENKTNFWTYIKIFLFFILRTFTLMIGIKLVYFIIVSIDILINVLFGFSTSDLPQISYVNLICFGISIVISLKTKYYVNGVYYIILKNEFGKFSIENDPNHSKSDKDESGNIDSLNKYE